MFNSFVLKIASGIFALFSAACLLTPMFIRLSGEIANGLNITRGVFAFLAALSAICTAFLARLENISEKSKDVEQFLQLIRESSPRVRAYIPKMYAQEIDEKYFDTLVDYTSYVPLATENSQAAMEVTQLIVEKFPKIAGKSAQFRNNGYSASLWMGPSPPPSQDFVRPLVIGLFEDVINDPNNLSAVHFLTYFFNVNEHGQNDFQSMFDGDVLAFLDSEDPGLLTRLEEVLSDIEQSADSSHVLQWCKQVRERSLLIRGKL